MLYVVNDLHGAPNLIEKTVEAIRKLSSGDSLIINGDGAGARGPIMNKVVKIFYEVRRGETREDVLLDAIKEIIGEKPEIPQEWIYNTVHAGLFRKLMAERYPRFAECMRKELKDVIYETLKPLSQATKEVGVRLLYLPGNGEVVPDDFSTDDITTEHTVPPEERFYQKLFDENCFEFINDPGCLGYIPYVIWSSDRTALFISTNLLDLSHEKILHQLWLINACDYEFSTIIVHYPPAIAPIGGMFDFWTPNKTDLQRINTLRWILSTLRLTKDVEIFFGHIHLGANDSRMDVLPSSMTFDIDGMRCTWVKPGVVTKVGNID